MLIVRILNNWFLLEFLIINKILTTTVTLNRITLWFKEKIHFDKVLKC